MGLYYDLFPCTYEILKGMVVKIFGKWHENLVSSIAITLTIVFLVIGFLLLFPWFICHFMLKIYLEFRHRDKFGGLLTLNSMMEHTKMTITIVFMLEHHGSYQQLLGNVKMSCQNLMRSHYRFRSTVHTCCGYYYFLKEQVTIDDVISTAEENCLTKKDMLDYLRKNCFHRLNGGVKLWNVKVFRNPINWGGDDKTCYYPVVITYNHCLADAICLAVFQQKHLLEDVVQKTFENALRKSKKAKKSLTKSSVLRLDLMKSRKNRSLLSNSENTGQNLALVIEKEPKYLGLIRELSKRFQCTFTDVFLIASVVVLRDYLGKKNIFPRKIIVGNTCRIFTEDTSALLNGRIFDNEVSLDSYALPKVESKSILEKFLELKEVLNVQRNSTISQFLYVGRRLMSYLPAEILVRLCRPFTRGCLFGLTNIPGVDFARFGSATVKDSFVFVNHFMGLKFIMGVHSFGGRLQVSLISDKYAVSSGEDLQELLDNVFKVFDDLR